MTKQLTAKTFKVKLIKVFFDEIKLLRKEIKKAAQRDSYGYADPKVKQKWDEIIAHVFGTCEWHYDGDTTSWDTECKNKFITIEGTPQENQMEFCPYCGKPILQAFDSLEPEDKE